MKSVFLILTIVSAVCGLSACLPLNFAQSTRGENINAGENRRASAADETANAQPPNNLSAAKTTTAPTPKTAPKKPANAVCPDPLKPCHHREREFAEWELPFQMPAKIVANKEYSSTSFYAIILKNFAEGCNPDEMDFDTKIEAERLKIQQKFPKNKVFAQYSCPNMDSVNYEFAGKLDAAGERVLYMDYISVYAGASEAEAREFFESIRADYPKAELKKMTAGYTRLEM